MSSVELGFGPCNCPSYTQPEGKELEEEPAVFYDTKRSAARAFLAALRAGEEPRVHWQERHVAAVYVDGEEVGCYPKV